MLMEDINAGVLLTLCAWLAITAAAACIICSAVRRRRANRSCPREEALVQVVSMERHVQHYRSHFYQQRHYAVFRLPDGKKMKFSIPEAEYDRLSEGDQGVLTWQGTRFLFFSRR